MLQMLCTKFSLIFGALKSSGRDGMKFIFSLPLNFGDINIDLLF